MNFYLEPVNIETIDEILMVVEEVKTNLDPSIIPLHSENEHIFTASKKLFSQKKYPLEVIPKLCEEFFKHRKKIDEMAEIIKNQRQQSPKQVSEKDWVYRKELLKMSHVFQEEIDRMMNAFRKGV